MSKNSRKLRIYFVIAFVSIIVLGIAYAALQATLTITFGNVTQNKLTWAVAFQGTSASGSVGGTSGTGRTCGTASISGTSVTVAATELSKPGDSCTYTLTVKNTGDINAKLTTITPTKPTVGGNAATCTTATGPTLACGNITYRLLSSTSGSGTVLATNTNLNAGASQTIYLEAKFTGTSLPSAAIVQNGAAFSLKYEQN